MNSVAEQLFLMQPGPSQPSGATQKLPRTPFGIEVNLENVQDLSKVCRTCAAITDNMIPIFSGEGLQNKLADKIHQHLPIHVSPLDRLPQCVCGQCWCALEAVAQLETASRAADIALRARLAQLDEQESTNGEIEQNNPKNESQEVSLPSPPQYPLGETPDPPSLPGLSLPPPVTLKTCEYCSSYIPQDDYRNHLETTHPMLVFHCEECDSYVPKTEFLSHLSVHAMQFVAEDAKKSELNKEDAKKSELNKEEGKKSELNKEEDKKDAKKPKRLKKKSELKRDNNNESNNSKPVNVIKPSESKVKEKEEEKAPAHVTEPTTVPLEDHNDFSDQSDSEYGFEPLPASVFEAIDDSQDGQSENIESASTLPKKPQSSESLNDSKRKRPRNCPMCGKIYTASSSYFYHIKYFHKKIKEHACDVCNRKFGTRSTLNQHMAIHTGECPYECKECGKKFKSNASLYIHGNTHKAVRMYSCSVCKAGFRWRTHLRRHMARHEEKKRHVCEQCGRAFAVRADLLRHEHTHKRGSHTCDHCGNTFAQRRYLKAHLNKQHSELVKGTSTAAVAS